MAEINKPTGLNKIWASTGNIAVPTDSKIGTGWVEEIPPHEYENYIQNRQDLGIAHINQHGIAIWDSVTEYQANKSLVQGSNGKIYKSTTTHRNINPVTDVTGVWFDINDTGMVVFNTPGVVIWDIPAILKSGFKKAKVTVTGGGGSGGSGTPSSRGAGGGAGGTGIGLVDLTGIAKIDITVGSGGARRTSGNASGTSGGISAFGLLVRVNGGGLGQSAGIGAAGGIGGISSGTASPMNIKGGDGSDGPNATAGGGSGDGGASYWGGGIRSGSGSVSNTVNSTIGSGGGGGTSVSSPGANGVVIVEW